MGIIYPDPDSDIAWHCPSHSPYPGWSNLYFFIFLLTFVLRLRFLFFVSISFISISFISIKKAFKTAFFIHTCEFRGWTNSVFPYTSQSLAIYSSNPQNWAWGIFCSKFSEKIVSKEPKNDRYIYILFLLRGVKKNPKLISLLSREHFDSISIQSVFIKKIK